MFRADERFGVEVPAMLAHAVGDAGYYRAVEATGHSLIWLLYVQDGSSDSELPGRWRRVFVANLDEALQLLGQPQWTARNLYVLAPPHLSSRTTLVLQLCTSVWECTEPEDDQICWRVETDQGPLLESLYGTEPGRETKRRLLWSPAESDGCPQRVS